MYFVDSFVLNGWWLLSCSTLFRRASYKSHLWCLCTQIQMHCTMHIQEYPKIGQLPRARTPTLSICIFVFFYSRNMRDSCLFYIIITLHFITFGLFSSYMCILLLFLLIYSVHLKLFANFIWCRRMPSFFVAFLKFIASFTTEFGYQ